MSGVLRFLSVVVCLSGCIQDEPADPCWSVTGINAVGADCELSTPAQFRDIGYVDVSLAGGYLLSFEMEVSDQAQCGGNVSLRGLEVELEFPMGFVEAIGDPAIRAQIEQGLSSTFLLSGSIEVFVGGDARFEVLSGALLDALDSSGALDDGASATVLVTATFLGEGTRGDVESVPFGYPIQMCSGCLKLNVGSCDALPCDYFSEPPCNLGQDSALECCTLPGGDELCPARIIE